MRFPIHIKSTGLLLMVFWLASCYEPQEGCIDPEAENYTLTADDPCCCDYPDRGVKLSFTWDSLNFRLNRDYLNEHGDTFRLTSLRYVASGFQWYYGADEDRVEDRIAGTDPSSGIAGSLVDDWVIIEAGQTQAVAGTMRRFGSVDSFRMQLGWGTDDPTEFMVRAVGGHPLDTTSSPMYESEARLWSALRLTVIYGRDGVRDTLGIRVPQISGVVALDDPYELTIGKDHFLSLKIGMLEWLGGVDWRRATNEIEAQIVSKMAGSHVLSLE